MTEDSQITLSGPTEHALINIAHKNVRVVIKKLFVDPDQLNEETDEEI